jgi:hypothetical protein
VRAWSASCRTWLDAHPGLGLDAWNADGDPIAVLAAAVRLLTLQWASPVLALEAADLAALIELPYDDVPLIWPGGKGHAARR